MAPESGTHRAATTIRLLVIVLRLPHLAHLRGEFQADRRKGRSWQVVAVSTNVKTPYSDDVRFRARVMLSRNVPKLTIA